MNKKPQPKRNNRSTVRREREPLPWKFTLATLLSGAVLVAGFLLAAKNHFTSIDYCIKNSELKKQLGELESEKRRLMLARETVLAPGEIKKAARRLGLVEMTAMNIEAVEPQQAPATIAPSNPLIRRTVDSKPVERPKTAVSESRDRIVPPAQRTAANPAEIRARRVSKTGN